MTVRLTPKETEVLTRLVAAEGSVVSVGALLDGVWGDEAVGPESLNRCISTLRSRHAQLCGEAVIETLHRRGYRVAVPVLRLAPRRVTRAALIGATASATARDLLMQARVLMGRRTPGDFQVVIRVLEASLEADPGYAAALIALADRYVVQALRRYRSPRLAGALALQAAERALAVEPEAAAARAVRGWVRIVIEGEPEAMADLDAAVAGDPGDWLIRAYRGWALAALGRADEGVRETAEGLRLLPQASFLVAQQGYLLFCAGEAEAALQLLRQGTAALPYLDAAFAALATVAAWLGLPEEAIAAGETACRLSDGVPFNKIALAYALARAGRRAEASQLLEGMARDDELRSLPTLLAPVLMELGRPEAARAALAEAEVEGCAFRGVARHDPRFAGLERQSLTERQPPPVPRPAAELPAVPGRWTVPTPPYAP